MKSVFRIAVMFVAAVLLAAPLSSPAAAQPESSCIEDLNASWLGNAEGQRGLLQDPGPSMPVVFVHGWVSSAHRWDNMIPEVQRILGETVAPMTFDYSHHRPTEAYPVSQMWVTHPDVGKRLRDWIVCLSDVSLENGGQGRVALVGHSMGGLAVREALNGDTAMGDRVAAIINMGTPHEGSDFGGDKIDFWDLNTAILNPIGAFKDLIELHTVENPAQNALGKGSPELAVLPTYPDNVPVWSGAGEVTLTQRFFFKSWTTPLGDVVVDANSATALAPTLDRLGGPETDVCDVLVPLDLAFPAGAAAALHAQWDVVYPCTHVGLPNNPNMVNPAIAQLAAASSRSARTAPLVGLRPDGLDELVVGMSPEEATTKGLVRFPEDSYVFTVEEDGYFCALGVGSGPYAADDFWAQFMDDGLARIYVRTPDLATVDGGVRIGATREAVIGSLGQPNDEYPGEYDPEESVLIYESGDNGYLFRIRSGVVVGVSVGTLDGLSLVEGCL